MSDDRETNAKASSDEPASRKGKTMAVKTVAGMTIDATRFREALFGQQDASLDAPSNRGTMPDAPSSGSSPAEANAGARTGYRKPPLETRFAKGQSGNPKGRPRGSGKGGPKGKSAQSTLTSSVDEAVALHLAKPMRVRGSGEVREVARAVGALMLLEQQAAGGSVPASRTMLDIALRFGRAAEQRHLEDQAFQADYPDYYSKIAAAYERTGEAVPDWIARPEDVHYSKEKGLRIIGPYDVAGLENHRLFKRWLDAMYIKTIYDLATFFSRPGARITLTMAEFFVLMTDPLMPTRWKTASLYMQQMTQDLIWAPRARLLQALTSAFESIGLKPPLTRPMPPVSDKVLRTLGINPKQIKAKFAADIGP